MLRQNKIFKLDYLSFPILEGNFLTQGEFKIVNASINKNVKELYSFKV